MNDPQLLGIFQEQMKYVEALTSQGIRATADPRRVEPPCVLVMPVSATFQQTLSCGIAPTEWTISIIGPGIGDLNGVRHLSQQTAAVLQGMEISGRLDVTSYSLDGGDQFPCFRITFETPHSDWLGVTTVRRPAAANT